MNLALFDAKFRQLGFAGIEGCGDEVDGEGDEVDDDGDDEDDEVEGDGNEDVGDADAVDVFDACGLAKLEGDADAVWELAAVASEVCGAAGQLAPGNTWRSWLTAPPGLLCSAYIKGRPGASTIPLSS
jgi:hypothetical protein